MAATKDNPIFPETIHQGSHQERHLEPTDLNHAFTATVMIFSEYQA